MKNINCKQSYDWQVCTRPTKTCLLLLALAVAFILSTTGCSILVATPPTAHVQIDGLNSQLGEFVVALNPCDDQQMDINLSERYALRLDFQWLLDQENNYSQLYLQQSPEHINAQMTPWMTCKYRF